MKPVKIGSEIWPILKLLEPIFVAKRLALKAQALGLSLNILVNFIEKSPGHFLADFLHLELKSQQAKLVC